MSLLLTTKKRYDRIATRWGTFFIGPRTDSPIPAGSLLFCAYCGEYVALITEEIAVSHGDNRLYIKEWQKRFTILTGDIAPKNKAGNIILCPGCGRLPKQPGGELVYLPVGPKCLIMAFNHRSQNGKK